MNMLKTLTNGDTLIQVSAVQEPCGRFKYFNGVSYRCIANLFGVVTVDGRLIIMVTININ